MSSTVKKIFTVLIVIVVMLVIAGLVINTLLPNVAVTIVNAIEDAVYRASGLSFDWNGDGIAGDGSASSYDGTQQDDNTGGGSGDLVEGF